MLFSDRVFSDDNKYIVLNRIFLQIKKTIIKSDRSIECHGIQNY